MITDKELINHAVERINNKLSSLKIDIHIDADANSYSFLKDDKTDTTFENIDYLITYLDGFEAALECILKSK